MGQRGWGMALILAGELLAAVGLSIFYLRGYALSSVSGLIAAMLAIIGGIMLIFGVDLHFKSLSANFSRAWYLLPILLNIVGALVIYLAFSDNNTEARDALRNVGIGLFVMALALNFIILPAITYILFLQFFSEEPDIGKKQIERQKAITQCKSLCEQVKTNSSGELKANVWEYCTQTFNLQKSGGLGDIVVSGVAGADSYCRSQTHCFDITECSINDTAISYDMCKSQMCKGLMDRGMSQAEAEQQIRSAMWQPVADSCVLEQGQKGIGVNGNVRTIQATPQFKDTFQNPTCKEMDG